MKFLLFILVVQLSFSAFAQYRVGRSVAQNSSGKEAAPKTGKQKAQEYFQADAEKSKQNGSSSEGPVGADDHYLALHVGQFMQSETWLWGQKEKQKDNGKGSFGVTYRFDEWGQTDLNVRFELNEFSVVDQKPLKFSILPIILFPEAGSKFPLYFGAGAGLGVFLKQVEGESNLSFDYQIFMGARFFNVYGSSGFFIETGLKNHLLLLSDGQFNGTYLSLGALFTF